MFDGYKSEVENLKFQDGEFKMGAEILNFVDISQNLYRIFTKIHIDVISALVIQW